MQVQLCVCTRLLEVCNVCVVRVRVVEQRVNDRTFESHREERLHKYAEPITFPTGLPHLRSTEKEGRSALMRLRRYSIECGAQNKRNYPLNHLHIQCEPYFSSLFFSLLFLAEFFFHFTFGIFNYAI